MDTIEVAGRGTTGLERFITLEQEIFCSEVGISLGTPLSQWQEELRITPAT